MNRPVRTTLILSFLAGFVIYPALATILIPVLGWPAAPKLILWAITALYALLLVRWSNTRLLSTLFPLLILLGAAVWPYVYAGFFLLLLGGLAWMRSGICFTEKPVRTVMAELVCVAGGAAMVGFWLPSSMLQWELGIWLFGLTQCLYFYIMGHGPAAGRAEKNRDSFEQARSDLARVLAESGS